jgi:hypothetical protein
MQATLAPATSRMAILRLAKQPTISAQAILGQAIEQMKLSVLLSDTCLFSF